MTVRRLLAALAFATAAPAQAQEAPDWRGVWEGRIGTSEVRACFDGWPDSPGRGSYYYARYLEPIALREGESAHAWIERAPGSDAEAQWTFAELSAERMRGTWRQGHRSLPFVLRPAKWEDANGDGPCGSTAFLGPRLEGGSVRSEQTRSTVAPPFTFTRHSYRPPAHLAEDVVLSTFTIAESQPGDARINQALRAYLPQGTPEDELHQCLAGALSSLGTDGWINHTLEPILLTRAFLGVEVGSSTFCGGAHPNHWIAYHAFDRVSGEEVDLFDWLGGTRAADDVPAIPAAVRALVFARWPASDTIAECRELFPHADYWTLGLRLQGMVFRPDFPHAATPCEESVVIDWATLAPHLNEQGRAGLDRLRQP